MQDLCRRQFRKINRCFPKEDLMEEESADTVNFK